MTDLVRDTAPDAVVHFAEQRSAPFSMINRAHAVETQVNNVVGTLNLLFALRDHAPDCHLVKLGTMGEYGTPNIDIEEGFIDITHNGRTDRLPFPKQPGSMYHLSKVHDSHNIALHLPHLGAARHRPQPGRGVRRQHHRDRAAPRPRHPLRLRRHLGHGAQPLLRAGRHRPAAQRARQGRPDARLPRHPRHRAPASSSPASTRRQAGEFRVFNQFTEQFSILDLAHRVRDARAAHGLPTEIVHQPNPRVELEGHYYNAKHQHLLDLGLQPHALADTLIEDVIHVVERHASRVRPHTLVTAVDWRKGGEVYGPPELAPAIARARRRRGAAAEPVAARAAR